MSDIAYDILKIYLLVTAGIAFGWVNRSSIKDDGDIYLKRSDGSDCEASFFFSMCVTWPIALIIVAISTIIRLFTILLVAAKCLFQK